MSALSLCFQGQKTLAISGQGLAWTVSGINHLFYHNHLLDIREGSRRQFVGIHSA